MTDDAPAGKREELHEGRGALRWGNGVQPVGGPFPHRTPPGRGRRASKLVIEIAANEDDVRKDQNPNVPYTPQEIAEDAIRCAEAGATIYHFHNKDRETGANVFDDLDMYLETASLIRAKSDLIFCPSYHFDQTKPIKPQLQYLREFAADPNLKPEIIGVVPIHEGGISSHYDPKEKCFYNPKLTTIGFLDVLRELDIKPVFDLFEVGHLREILAYLDYGLIEEPLATKMFFSDVGLYGVPPTPQGIMAFDALLDARYDWQFLVSLYGPAESKNRDFGHSLAVALGHHVRLGIGDLIRNGFYVTREMEGAERSMTNVDLVEQAVGWAKAAGREVANAREAREIFGIKQLG